MLHKGIFQSKTVMGRRTFSTLQVSFGQLNFVSKTKKQKQTEKRKSKNNKQQVSIKADKPGSQHFK